jgi:hypothetical protein
MANGGVQGRVVDTANPPVGIKNLIIEVYDHDVLSADDFLGTATTDASGAYSVSYTPGSYGLEANPDVIVKVFDSVKRLLYVSDVQKDVTAATLNFPDIPLNRKDAEGWLVTLGSGAATALSNGNAVDFLVDNADAWDRFTKAVDSAQSSVSFLNFIWMSTRSTRTFQTASSMAMDPLRATMSRSKGNS